MYETGFKAAPPFEQGVSFEQKLVECDVAYRQLYNSAVDLWYDSFKLIKEMQMQGGLMLTPKVRQPTDKVYGVMGMNSC